MITALPEIAQNVGVTRIVRGYTLTAPVGNPYLQRTDEREFRKKIVWRALETLTRKVEGQLIVDYL